MSPMPQIRTLNPGAIVRVVYYTARQMYSLEGVVTEDKTDAPGTMVSFENDPNSPVTTARVYTSNSEWLDALDRAGKNPPFPGGYIRTLLHDSEIHHHDPHNRLTH